ncbi:MAG: electron transfer flavoprotein subunit beta/FixA family protein [Kiritimatiellia bacterium]|jgi:electron transfer flavoprotein beta subunit|nr:electron transfer flavoprotein subunit beta/FixA family protein [Kiritimatiellia bacterium]MDP6630193.1 electron transfer flavoprotein subunit beta/FixA family protein [Kiritimatiellia bacterium]MDP6810719.1 electron transfer flavoprotein subunit beta/FixA family protein [Kiritimatiellia bacterium]MDP7023294.1 electron transfer flavoprotein subunit beta/FixA family protein [Kiritimatiellia bacterium]
MHFVVCIKQVPEKNDVKINPETNTLMREGVESIVNPFDAYAIEESVRLKERVGGKVTAITMGPPQAEAVLREAISVGVDEGILISDRAFAGSDTFATSYTLAQAIKKLGDVDIILCGKQASDGDTAQVGPGIATHLDLPQITYVRKIEEIEEGRIVGERLLETGYEVIESSLPCLLTVVKEINEPRLPSLKGKMASKKAEIPVWTAADMDCRPEYLGLDGSPTKVDTIFTPPPRGGGEILTGDPEEIVPRLIEKLKELVVGAAS